VKEALSARSSVWRSLALAALLLAGGRAAFDVRSVARDRGAVAALPLFPAAAAEAATFVLAASLPIALLLGAALGRPRGSRRRVHPIAIFLGFGAALLVALEVWLRAFDALKLPPGAPPPAALIRGPLLRAALVAALGVPVLALSLHALLRRAASTAPGPRAIAAAAALLVVASAAASIVPPALAKWSDRTTRAARLARLSSPPNVLVIVLDTVRADRISCYGFPADATPEIDRLAREGTTFVNATAAAPWTLPSHASLFTGRYPSEHGAHYGHLRLDDDETTMAEILRSVGYRTVGFSKKAWLSRGMGTLQGFEQYEDFRIESPRNRLFVPRLAASVRALRFGRTRAHADAGGKAIATAAARWIRNRARARDRGPFFGFVNFNEAHLPFLPPRPYFLRFAGRMPGREALIANLDPMPYIAGELPLSAEDVAVLRALYAGEIAYVDRQIGLIVGALEETGELDRTVVVVTSDHGENIGDHGLMGHVLCVYDTLLRIPLVVRYPPRFARGALDDRLVELTDLLPTIVDVVDQEATDLFTQISGESLLRPDDRGFAIAEYQQPDDYLDQYPPRFPAFDPTPYRRDLMSLVAGSMKLIEGSDGRRELYDVAADPGESHDLAATDTLRAAELAGVLARFRAGLRAHRAGGQAPELDDETREELRSLGYIK